MIPKGKDRKSSLFGNDREQMAGGNLDE